jgi:type II secretory pathway predicted ATPase ExeA
MTSMTKTAPYPYQDFVRAKEAIAHALVEEDDTYLLLTGEPGTGKTAILRQLREDLDRCRYRILYFAETRRLGPAGFVRVLARALRQRPSRSHAETVHDLIRVLGESAPRLLLWFDEAQDLPEETLTEARGLVEASLESTMNLQILLCGLPPLRAHLQEHPQLWRRIVVREEITGLQADEVEDFLVHHFGTSDTKRICDEGMTMLFEHARGAPGLIVPMMRTILRRSPGKGKIAPEQLDDTLQRWDLA